MAYYDCEDYDDSYISYQSNRNSLVNSLESKRDDFCRIGTNKTKRRLNKLIDSNPIAKAVRLALEIEDKNICAKKYRGTCSDKIYHQKSELIEQLVAVFQANPEWVYGVQDSDVGATSHIIYFEIPWCRQISWHFSTEKKYPEYTKAWDKLTNSTLGKLEKTAFQLLDKAGLFDKEKKIVEKNKEKWIPRKWLESISWEWVEEQNVLACHNKKERKDKLQQIRCKIGRGENYENVRTLWNEAMGKAMSLEEVVEFIKLVRSEAPFLSLNGVTFRFVGKKVVECIENERFQNIVGGYIKGEGHPNSLKHDIGYHLGFELN